jgi:Tfp pilus assembly protein PilO
MALDWQTEYHRYQHYFSDISTLYRHKKVRVYTEFVLTILVICFFLFFAIKPTLVTITGLAKALSDQKLVAQKLEEKINSLNLAQSQYNLVQPDLYLLDEAIPVQPQITTLIKQLETLGKYSGVTVDGIQLSQVNLMNKKIVPSQESIDFSIAVSGEYQNLKNFLKSISSFRRVILIDNFGFKTGKTDKLTLYLSLNNNAFYGINENGVDKKE